MHGVTVNGRRPKSKKEIKAALASNPESVSFDTTSMFGGSDYNAATLPEGKTITFVGPDPYTKRSYYGNVSVKGGKIKLS